MVSLHTMNTHSALHIRMLANVSQAINDVLEQQLDTVSDLLPFRETYAFLQRLKPWHPAFVKPPMRFLRSCELDGLASFYQVRTSFELFDCLSSETQQIIRHEAAYHLARTAMDTFMGVRLRNLAHIGIQRPEWPQYKQLVDAYFDETLSRIRREKMAAIRQRIESMPSAVRGTVSWYAQPHLFHDVDRLRLMSHGQFENHIEAILQRGRPVGTGSVDQGIPDEVLQSLEWLDLPERFGPEALKQRYRELALIHHPDKGGTRERMQMLNTAYEVVRDYLDKLEARRSQSFSMGGSD